MTTTEKIKEIKSRLGEDLLVLAHHYQKDEIVALADFVGDSLKLAQYAEKNKRAKYIVFCGVHFMAETADMLTEDDQLVFLPAQSAGCPMADMADIAQAERAWEILTKEFDESIIPITYINSRADIKAFCGKHGGSSVTSGNAPKVMKWGFEQGKRILFLPDMHLGRNTAKEMGVPLENMASYDRIKGTVDYVCPKEDVKLILWNGYCHVHHAIKPEMVENARQLHPNAKIVVHPECPYEVTSISDGYGSTEYLINVVRNAPSGSEFVIGTEGNLVKRVARENPDKKVYILDNKSYCINMNKTTLENLLETLEEIEDGDFSRQITVSKSVTENALVALKNMLSL